MSTLLAFGESDTGSIVSVHLNEDESLTILIELPLGEERITLTEQAVVPAVRALAESPGSERAA